MGPLLRSLAIVSMSCGGVASAQVVSPPDTLPFHRGQWAAQFGAGTSFASLGFLKFTTASHAWLIDLRLNGGHSHTTTSTGDTITIENFTSNAVASARVGRRFYQARGKAVASFQTLGALGGYGHQCNGGQPLAAGSCENGWNAGVFGELGGVYLLSPRFSIGGSAAASFSYERFHAEASGFKTTHWDYSGSLQGLTFMATIYF